MASNLVLKSGSPHIGSPITYKVTAASLTGIISFHRVVVKVKAALSTDTDWTITQVSTPVNEGEIVELDISSALQAVADRYQYEPIPPTAYPFVKYSLSAYDEYMQNGEVHQTEEISNEGGNALFGAKTDLERLFSDGNSTAQHFSRKPKSEYEIVSVGESVVVPQSFPAPVSLGNVTTGPSSAVFPVTTAGMQTIGGRNFYALNSSSPDRLEFRFVNGLGCLESISLLSLRSVEVNITSETYIRSVQETFGNFSRGLITKQNDYETWKLSSGPVSPAMQAWFLHEFLMSSAAWIKVGTVFIPCHIVPEETVTGVNRADGSMREVHFSVQFDINGSPEIS